MCEKYVKNHEIELFSARSSDFALLVCFWSIVDALEAFDLVVERRLGQMGRMASRERNQTERCLQLLDILFPKLPISTSFY